MRLRSIFAALFMALAGAASPFSLAQDKPAAEAPADPQIKKAAQGLIENLLEVSHSAEIFADLRRTLREVYIPALRDMVEGSMPGVPPPDAKTAATLAKVLTFADYLRKAGDELDAALSENREAMISDVAGQITKTASSVDINDIQHVLELPAIRKGLDAVYSMSRLITGFTYNDARTFSEFSAWVKRQDLDWQQVLPGAPGGAQAVPSTRKVAKAQALVNDLLAISHADEIAADVNRFVRDVYAEMAPMTGQERQELLEKTEQFEFLYNMQKAVVLAAAPSVVAAALSDDQLAVMHGFVRSAAFAKAFDLLRNVVKSGTALTKSDVLEAQNSFQALENKAKRGEPGKEEQDKAKEAWDALAKKWTDILKSRISPETRSGLEQSLEDLKNEGSPI